MINKKNIHWIYRSKHYLFKPWPKSSQNLTLGPICVLIKVVDSKPPHKTFCELSHVITQVCMLFVKHREKVLHIYIVKVTLKKTSEDNKNRSNL